VFMGSGTMAPAQHLMGHFLLLAMCPNSPHSLHITCAWKGEQLLDLKKFQRTLKCQ
jgi:hypothetical protein